MFAIIKTGGRQVKVTPGAFVQLEGTAGEPGAELTLGDVLFVEKDGGDILAGAPFVADADHARSKSLRCIDRRISRASRSPRRAVHPGHDLRGQQSAAAWTPWSVLGMARHLSRCH